LKILAVDIGTGTQDILLYDARLDIENAFKLILPSPTMIVHRRIRAATAQGLPIALTGHQMGGGPSAWAAEAHARAGLPVYATPEAAKTLDDEPEKVAARGIRIISEEEVRRLPGEVLRLELRDFDFPAIAAAFAGFGVALGDLDAIAAAVFDHGAAPPGVSDRQFRFDYLDRRIREKNSLSAFAYMAPGIPASMSRLASVAESAPELPCPLIVMDTAPAAVLGATLDPRVGGGTRRIIVNVGNFHTLAFRMGPGGIEGVFEHHTGEINRRKLELLLRALAAGTLKHADVFNDMGHGALIYEHQPFVSAGDDYDMAVTGPRRSIFAEDPGPGDLRPYFAVPFGDMMIAGCFGLLAAAAELLPDFRESILESLQGAGPHGVAPWDVD
jgi:uncharacterized protein (DUF1786 family)